MADDPITEARRGIDRSRREFIEQQRWILDKGHTQSERLDAALLTLTAGALLLSITFVGTLPVSKQCLGLLFAAWGGFILSMISVLIAMMRAQHQSHDDALETAKNFARFSEMDFPEAVRQRVTFNIRTQKTVASLNVFAIICFIAGIGFLCSFVGINLSQPAAVHNQSRKPAYHQQDTPQRMSPASTPQAEPGPSGQP